MKIQYQGIFLPLQDFHFKLCVGLEPSFVFLYCLKSTAASFLSSVSGNLIIDDEIHPAITFPDMHFIRTEPLFGNLDPNITEDMCQLVLADERITWYQRSGGENYNLLTSDRNATDAYTINSTSRTIAKMTNLNSAVPWGWESLLSELNMQQSGDNWVLSIFGSWPVDSVPLHILGHGRTKIELWQQVLHQSNMYFVPFTHAINQLGVIEDTAVVLPDTCKDAEDTAYVGLINPALHANTTGRIRGATDITNYDAADPKMWDFSGGDDTSYDIDIGIPIVGDFSDLSAWYSEVQTRYKTGIDNTIISRRVFAGFHDVTLGHIAQSVEWIATQKICQTIVRRFYSPTKRPQFNDTYHSYGRWPNGGGSGMDEDGFDASNNRSMTRQAVLTGSAGTSLSIAADLLDKTGNPGTSITVYFHIMGGSSPVCNVATPFMQSGRPITVYQSIVDVTGTPTKRWFCTTVLNAFCAKDCT